MRVKPVYKIPYRCEHDHSHESSIAPRLSAAGDVVRINTDTGTYTERVEKA